MTAPGWYLDPWTAHRGGYAGLRWWTGRNWSAYTWAPAARRRSSAANAALVTAAALWLPVKFTFRGLSFLR